MGHFHSLLTDPHPSRHIVYPYNDEDKAIYAVALFASSGLSKGESVVLIMADTRCKPILEGLTKSGFDVVALQASGQLECVSAEEMLRGFTREGTLDEELASATIAGIIRRARKNSAAGKVRVFGEMVSFLLAQSKVEVAERLEEVWNQLIVAESISLLCTYTLIDSGCKILPECLAKLHSHNLTFEGAMRATALTE